VVKTLPTRSPLIRHLEYRMHKQGMSNFIIETGKKGSGKSWLGLRIGQLIMGEDKFSMDNVCFSSTTLLDRLDKKMYKCGDVVLLEELGVSANSRDFMTKTNKNLSMLAQTIRPEAITLIANTITWSLIDFQVKNMADYRIKVLGYDKQEGITEFKFLALSPQDDKEKPREEHLQFNDEKYVSWIMKRPTVELTDIYEPIRKDYMRKLYSGKGINKDKDFGIEEKKFEHTLGINEYVENGMSIKDKLTNQKGKVDPILVQLHLNIRDRQKATTVAKGIMLRWEKLL
jgi:hypothetical protein